MTQPDSPLEPELNIIRAGKDCICPLCGKEYWRHPRSRKYLDWNGEPFLREICNGKLVKL